MTGVRTHRARTRIFFPWDAFYQKLPVRPGDYWKLDFLCWGTKTSWGGSQGVHESSSWGHLVFNLKGEEVTAIRKRLILGHLRPCAAALDGPQVRD